jgi:uncharacterized protein (DUF1778 family)
VRVRLGEDEYAALAAAARASGLTPTGYAAQAAVAAARRARHQTPRSDTEAVRELMTTRAQLRRYGNNLNQVARSFNAGGQPPEWLAHAITLTNGVVARIDAAVQDLLHGP